MGPMPASTTFIRGAARCARRHAVGWLASTVFLCACGNNSASPAERATSPDALITDTLHLLGEAASLSTSGREREAAAAWTLSYQIFREHLAEPIRARDAQQALEIEVRYGRVSAGLRARADVEPDAMWIDATLDDARVWLEPALADAAAEGDVSLR